MLEQFCSWLVAFVDGFGYAGLFIMAFLGNVLVPVPAELIMIPAGYLVHQHEMSLWAVLASAIAGDISGSLFGYYVAFHFGRRFLYAYGKYLFFNHEKMAALNAFFARHGEISVLTGRLTPGLRHFMAFPAGMAHMNVRKFMLYTGGGGGLWMAILLAVGYVIGGEKALVKHYVPIITYTVIALVLCMLLLYARNHRKKRSRDDSHVA